MVKSVTCTPTGEKPHRCHLCPFASAYERHLEAHMRSHTGEKPYKCELCSFRCSDRSNLSHHRRRKHKMVPIKGTRPSLSSKKMWGVLQKKTSNLGYSRRALINLSPPSMVVQKPDYLNDFTHEIPNIQTEAYDSMTKPAETGGLPRDPQDLMVDNPLNQLSTLAGQLSSLPPENQNPPSPDVVPCQDEKPFMMQQPAAPAVPAVSSIPQSSSPTSPDPRPAQTQRNYSPVAGPSSDHSAHASTPSISNSQPSTPAPTLPVQDPQLLHHCQHCDMYFADNILYTIHMGCHGFENPFQCNICGCKCKNKYDFACHFARGQHSQHWWDTSYTILSFICVRLNKLLSISYLLTERLLVLFEEPKQCNKWGLQCSYTLLYGSSVQRWLLWISKCVFKYSIESFVLSWATTST